MTKTLTKAAQAKRDGECRSAGYENQRLTLGSKVEVTATTSELRNRVLLMMGPVTDCMYDAAALTLLNEFEAALRADWERIERAKVRGEADKAIADALGLPVQWRLL